MSSFAAKATIWRTCCRCGSQPLSERQFSRSIELVNRSEVGNGSQELAQRLPVSTSSQEPIAEPQLPVTAESSRPEPGTAEEETNPASTARAPVVQPQPFLCARCALLALHLVPWQSGDIIIKPAAELTLISLPAACQNPTKEHSPLNFHCRLCLLVVWVWPGGCGTALWASSTLPFPACDRSFLRRHLICPGSVCTHATCSRLVPRHPAF